MSRAHPAFQALASLKLTISCLSLLMAVVILCTLDQVRLGTFLAVRQDMRAFFLYWTPPGTSWRLPFFPGGALVGLMLLANLVASFALRFELSRRKLGIWVIHAGLILLVLGEFIAGAFQVETQMPIEVGQTRAYTESPRASELAVVDATDPAFDRVYSVPQSLLERGGLIEHPAWPFALLVKRYFQNATLERRDPKDNWPPPMATAGIGASMTVRDLPPVTTDDANEVPAAFIEAVVWDRSLGSFLLWGALGAPQGFSFQGRRYLLALRPKRHYLSYALTLKEFKHDIYPGTDIPKNFSSLVRLKHPEAGEDREVLIYMNHPLRYAGKSFYQASFGKDDQLSVLQVVTNPGWRLPYLSCSLIAVGLLIQFLAPFWPAAKGASA